MIHTGKDAHWYMLEVEVAASKKCALAVSVLLLLLRVLLSVPFFASLLLIGGKSGQVSTRHEAAVRYALGGSKGRCCALLSIGQVPWPSWDDVQAEYPWRPQQAVPKYASSECVSTQSFSSITLLESA